MIKEKQVFDIMAVLQLHNRMSSDALILPGVFIDSFLPAARGEDVKVFLYLLRLVSRPDTDVSLASLADGLDTSEREILKALTYWEKTGLLRLSFNSDHVLESVCFLPISAGIKEETAAAANSAGPTPAKNRPDTSEQAKETKEAKAAASKPVPRDLTPKEIAALDGDLDFNGLVFMAEQSFGSPLNATDISRLGYWYINFNRSLGILESLLEYCAVQCQPGSANTRYLDKVAAGWFADGISSAEQAREHSQTRNDLVYGVMKAFGLKNKRDPNPTELELIRKWSKDYGFSSDMITLACTRTAAKTNTDQFAYADSILSAWHAENISTQAQVEEADLKHRKRTQAAKQPVEISRSARQFHNFEERDTDYEELILNQLRSQYGEN